MKEKNIQELAIRMGLITVEDMCQYTIAQLVVKIANKVNELVNEVWRFETDVQETLKTQNENIQYLLGEGLHLEVENIFDGWVQDGTFDTLLNQSALKKVNDRIDETNAHLSTKANKNDYKYIPKSEEELTQLLLEGKSVYINKDLNLTHTIHINKDNVEVEFDKSVTINMNDKSFPAITIGSESFKPTYVRVKFPKIVGNKTDGSIGILVKNMGFNSEIFNPTIQGMERGIKTNDFDCMQLNSIYEPLLVGNKIGFDDTNGGIQACRIFGGRIEQNSDYGIIIASPNVHFLGTVIEGNGKSEVKLLNKFSTQYQMNHPSGARFVSCYFEHVSDNEESEGSIFILGDETQNNGWFGHLDLVGCDVYTSGSECNKEGKTLIKLTGNALASGESQKTINIFGGTFGLKQVFDLQNVDTDTVITAHGVNMFSNNSKDINYHVNAKAKLICSDRTGAQQMSSLRTGYVCGGSVSDVSVKPCDYVYTKVLRVEPTQNEKGTFISVTCSNKYPWDDTMSGSIVGSLHYYSLNKTWYQRILVKNGTDVDSNWIALKKDDDKQVYGKPTLKPDRLYQHAYDYTNKKLYVAFGTSTIDDWVLI